MTEVPGQYEHSLLSMWTVYDRPQGFPHTFVARRWVITPTPVATQDIIVAKDLASIRTQLRRLGLVQLMRSPSDDEKIVETWV